MTRNQTLAALTIVLLLGALIRAVNLGDQPLWTDEGFSGMAALHPDLFTVLLRDVHPPLYFVSLRGWAGLAGVSELALRWFTLLPSMVSIALMVPLSREVARLRGGQMAWSLPVIAALLMAVAEMEFYIAQEVRSYSLHVMLGMASMWAFLRWARTHRRSMAAAWVLILTALVYTHYLGAWIGVVQGVYALIFLRGRQRWTAVGLLFIPPLLFSPWLLGIVLPYQVGKAESDAIIDPSTPATLLGYARDYLTGQWALMLGLLVAGLGVVRAGRFKLGQPWHIPALLLMWIVIPVALTAVGNLRFSVMTVYRISLITPALVLLWTFGLVNFPRTTRAFLLLVVVGYGVFTVDFYRIKFPEREFAALASQFVQLGDAVLIDLKGADFSPYYYLSRQVPPGVAVFSLRQYAIWDSAGLYNVVLPHLHAAETVWILRWNDDSVAFDLVGQGGHVRTARRLMVYENERLEAHRFDHPSVFGGLDGAPLTMFGPLALRHAEFDPATLRADLWWSLDEAVTRDLTTSVIVLDSAGRVVAQYDSMPFLAERPTSTWEAGRVMYEPKPLVLADGLTALPPGDYRVGVQVYAFTPDMQVEPFAPSVGDQPYYPVADFTVR